MTNKEIKEHLESLLDRTNPEFEALYVKRHIVESVVKILQEQADICEKYPDRAECSFGVV